MILAAGIGDRMRPLTDNTPKPLLKIAGKPMIVYHIEALVAAGVVDIVINHSYLGYQIESELGNGAQYGARIVYSPEVEPLETAGGIYNALSLLGEDPFIVCNGDIWTDYPFKKLVNYALGANSENPTCLAHLVMVKNPQHHIQGDFSLGSDGLLRPSAGIPLDASCEEIDRVSGTSYTYSGISLMAPQFLANYSLRPFALLEPLLKAMQYQQVSGEFFDGTWIDIGTPQRLQEIERLLAIN